MDIQQCSNPIEIIEVIHAAFKRYENDIVPSSALLETALSIKEELKAHIIVFGVREQGRLIAVVKCKLEIDTLYFSRLSVLPSEQGRGIATQLIGFIERYALTQYLVRVMCKVRKNEEGNIRLYKKSGYHIIEEENIVNKAGLIVPTVTMEKRMI